jgi:hypothetical protein
MISIEEHNRPKRRDRQVLELTDFTDADVAVLEQTRAPESSKAFDDELRS